MNFDGDVLLPHALMRLSIVKRMDLASTRWGVESFISELI